MLTFTHSAIQEIPHAFTHPVLSIARAAGMELCAIE